MRALLSSGMALVLVLGACTANTGRVLKSKESDQSPQVLAARADSLFAVAPRTPSRAQAASRVMREATRASDPEDPQRYRYLVDAAR